MFYRVLARASCLWSSASGFICLCDMVQSLKRCMTSYTCRNNSHISTCKSMRLVDACLLGTVSCLECLQLAAQGLGYRVTQVLSQVTSSSMLFLSAVKLFIGFSTYESSGPWTANLSMEITRYPNPLFLYRCLNLAISKSCFERHWEYCKYYSQWEEPMKLKSGRKLRQSTVLGKFWHCCKPLQVMPQMHTTGFLGFLRGCWYQPSNRENIALD